VFTLPLQFSWVGITAGDVDTVGVFVGEVLMMFAGKTANIPSKRSNLIP
jgi:hypothetical protein